MRLILWILGFVLFVGGEGAKQSSEAYVTLLYGDEFLLGVRVLGKSIRDTGSTKDIVALVSDGVSDYAIQLLKADGWTVEKISLLANPNEVRPTRFWGVYTKLKIFNMTNYRKVVYLDADTIVVKSIEDLFKCEKFCANLKHSERLNSGVMVVEPSKKIFEDMMSKVTMLPSYTGGDQGFLNSYYAGFPNAHLFEPDLSQEVLKARTVPEMERLSTLYNADVGLYMLANKWMVDEKELRVIHYTLGPLKPWDWWTSWLLKPVDVWQTVRVQLHESLPGTGSGKNPNDELLVKFLFLFPLFVLLFCYYCSFLQTRSLYDHIRHLVYMYQAGGVFGYSSVTSSTISSNQLPNGVQLPAFLSVISVFICFMVAVVSLAISIVIIPRQVMPWTGMLLMYEWTFTLFFLLFGSYLHLIYQWGKHVAHHVGSNSSSPQSLDYDSGKGHSRQLSSFDVAAWHYWLGLALLAVAAPALPCVLGITALFARVGLMVVGGIVLSSFMTYASEHLAIGSFVRGFEDRDTPRTRNGDYEKAGMYYMASVKENSKPHEFVLPYYGLGQVQLKLGDLRSALSNFEKVLEVHPENCETLKALGSIYVQLAQPEKAQEFLKKATKIDPREPQAFLDLGEILISADATAALDAFKTARHLLKKRNEEVPTELLNNIGVLHFERGEFELAKDAFKEALGDGIWLSLLVFEASISSSPTKLHTDGEFESSGEALDPSTKEKASIIKNVQHPIDASSSNRQYKDFKLFHRLEEQGILVELPWNKVSALFNLARLLEQLHETEMASIFYRLILFKYPDYVDAYLRLAAIARARNNLPLSIELVGDALMLDEKCQNALLMLGELELKNDDWVKAKETFRSAKDATDGKDSYATLCLGNWNYFAAIRSEKRNPKLEATHLEKAKELFTKVLFDHNSNLYAANGAGVILAEKGQFDISKDLFTQVQEAASGGVFVQMPDVWINLAHVHFAQGNFTLAVKMYQNCLRRFYHNTDSQVLLYLARTHYEAEQWQECKKALLRAIHLAPSNYTLKFDVGVALQKFSASTLQKEKRTVDEVRATVAELKNAVRLFSMLSAASNLQFHGFDEKKIETHVQYCKHLLEAAKVHCEAAEREDQQNKQRLELARQVNLAEETRRQAEEKRKVQLEKRKQEDEMKQLRQQEEHLQRLKEQWKSSGSKRKDRSQLEDDETGESEKRRKGKGGKKRKKEKRPHYDSEDAEPHMDDREEMDEDNLNYTEALNETNNVDQDALAAAGLEDSDAEEEAAPTSNAVRRRWGFSESDEDEPLQKPEEQGDDDMENGDAAANDD